jgi:hypothetical protein
MVDEQQILKRVNEVLSYKDMLKKGTKEGGFNKISISLVSLQNELREGMQKQTSSQVSKVIEKLTADEDITHDDMELIRTWVTSDAQFYVEMENDYPNWLKELNRLFSVIGQLKSEELTLEKMGRMSGTARDAIRVIGDVIFFQQQQDRLSKFEKASRNLDTNNKLFLARLLQRKLESDEV